MPDETPGLDAAEKKARRLLWWATVLALVAVAVMALDIMIKNAILDEAKRSQKWIDRLREDVAAHGGGDSAAAGSPDPADDSRGQPWVHGVGDAAGAPQGPGGHAGV